MMIVADVDLVAYMALPATRTPVAMAAFARDPHWTAPANLRDELLNVISKNVRARKVELKAAILAYQEALSLVEWSDQQPTDTELLELSAKLRTSTYDSAYVWLARRLVVRLVTGDAGLVQCAPDVAIQIEEHASGK